MYAEKADAIVGIRGSFLTILDEEKLPEFIFCPVNHENEIKKVGEIFITEKRRLGEFVGQEIMQNGNKKYVFIFSKIIKETNALCPNGRAYFI